MTNIKSILSNRGGQTIYPRATADEVTCNCLNKAHIPSQKIV